MPKLKTIAAGFIGSFFLIQIISLMLTAFFPSIPLFQGGNAILVMLLAIGIITLFTIGLNVEELKKKESLVFIVIVFALIAVAYWKLPETFPQLFSISPEVSYTIKQAVGSIFGG